MVMPSDRGGRLDVSSKWTKTSAELAKEYLEEEVDLVLETVYRPKKQQGQAWPHPAQDNNPKV
jgi:hypothetical protein